MRARKPRYRSDDWRTEQDVADGHYTSRNDRAVPICILDCGLAPFRIQHVLRADSDVVPPLEEDNEKTSGFKVPKSATPRDEFLDRTLWLSDMVNAEEVTRLTEVVCNICYNPVFSGQTLCFSCGHRVIYGPVEMDVEVDDDAIADDRNLERPIAPEAIASAHKRNHDARVAAASKVGQYGLLVAVNSEFAPIKKELQDMCKHRHKWDHNFKKMAAKGQ